jgi:hypothetical protein
MLFVPELLALRDTVARTAIGTSHDCYRALPAAAASVVRHDACGMPYTVLHGLDILHWSGCRRCVPDGRARRLLIVRRLPALPTGTITAAPGAALFPGTRNRFEAVQRAATALPHAILHRMGLLRWTDS